MGMNYYLKGDWLLPSSRLGQDLERLVYNTINEKGNTDVTITLDLPKISERTDKLHIGKSSLGWHFSLCIYPYMDILSLEDWKRLFETHTIVNEEGEEVPKEEMLDIITNRKAYNFDKFNNVEEYEKYVLDLENAHEKNKYKTYDDVLKANSARRGKNGLLSRESTILDFRNKPNWELFMPILSTNYHSDGTYDLTTNWEFE